MARITSPKSARRSAPRAAAAAAKMLPGDARTHHRALVLQHLFDDGPASRADLARLTGLTRVTVSDVVADLVEDGFVVELGVRPGTHLGKPAKLVGVNPTGGYIACLDLSGDTVLHGAVVDLEGTTVERIEVPLDGARGEQAVRRTVGLARDLVAAAPGRVLGVGVGSPGVVSLEGVVWSAPNLGWNRLDLRARLGEELELPVHVANDADTAVLAEDTFGEGNGSGMLLVEISHGVGAGILLDGVLLRGPDGAAGEIGHVTVDPDGPECSCGRLGCLESFLAVPRLRSRIDGLSPADADAVLRSVGEQLGRVLAPVVQALGLRDVVLSGPLELLAGTLMRTAESTVLGLTRAFGDARVHLRMSALGRDGVLVGAAALVLDGELGLT